MDDPKRLSDSDSNDALARLLRGAQALQVDYDLPAAVARHERLVAAGVPPLAPASGLALRGWWIGCAIAVVGAAAMWAARGDDAPARPAVVMLESPAVERASIAPVAIPVEPSPAVAAPVVEPAPPRTREGTPAARRGAPRPAASGSTSAADDRIAREAAQVRRIRELLDDGDAAAALRACDDGDREFTRGVFTLERDGLRVLAALALARPSADKDAAAYLDAHPRAPLAGRIRTALGAAR
jgi:hypothetical protein